MMQKIHKNRFPVPARIIVQGFSYLVASAKFISFLGYCILKELTTHIPFHEIRAEYEYKGLDNALNAICDIRQQAGPPTLIELDVEGCYPSIRHSMVNDAFEYFFEFVPRELIVLYVNVWARSLWILDHAMIQVDKQIYRQTSGLSQ